MSDRVAIVTGGTGALGRHIVEKLESEGYKVYVPALTMDEFNSVFDRSSDETGQVRVRKIFAFDCDALDHDSVKEFAEKVLAIENGNVGYLVNTIGGIDAPAMTDELDRSSIERMMNLNFYTAFSFTSCLLKTMKSNKFGRIISIGALAGLQTSSSRLAYSVSKQALINLMDTVSEEFKDLGIRCNTIVPGIIDTPANREWGTPDEIADWVSPQDIAEVVSSLFSEGFRSVRGSVIKVVSSL
ncbi:MAG: SDR family NAD(P)-dependent oxidoreductase [Ignavibacteria bacterium]|nr:SDR family NAD(P)-dependent oxidoreductase [Ignavibacteria bacterium]